MSAHADLLRLLLPPVVYDKTGAALNADLKAHGNQLDEFMGVVQELLTEIDPRTTTLLLSNWEKVYGLPDAGLIVPQTIAQRQQLLTAKVGAIGGLSKPYIVGLLQAAGYTASIDQPRGFYVGINRCGDPLWGAGATVWYFNVQISFNGQPLTPDQITQVTNWLNDVKPGPSTFTLNGGF
jgi:uncharacterized protein YmfQ (DUF2313 family)